MELSGVASVRPAREAGTALRTGLPFLDTYTGGFFPGLLTLVDSSNAAVFDLVSHVCAETSGRLALPLVLIDGGNCTDPYGIASICRKRGIDARETLSRIHVARAFTAYQLSSLILEHLPQTLDKTGARGVLVTSLVDMFTDPDIAWHEAFHMLRDCVFSLRDASVSREIPVIVTNLGISKIASRKPLAELMATVPGRVLHLSGLVADTIPRPHCTGLCYIHRGEERRRDGWEPHYVMTSYTADHSVTDIPGVMPHGTESPLRLPVEHLAPPHQCQLEAFWRG